LTKFLFEAWYIFLHAIVCIADDIYVCIADQTHAPPTRKYSLYCFSYVQILRTKIDVSTTI